jgi:hypothetical protein
MQVTANTAQITVTSASITAPGALRSGSGSKFALATGL